MNVLLGLVTVLTVAAIGYQLWSAVLVRAFVKQRAKPMSVWPSVTLLKPLYGDEPNLYDNLRSFCFQDYENLQVVFGVHTQDDAAIPTFDRLKTEFPHLDMILVVGQGRPKGGNPKVANLLSMLPAAKNHVLVIADSDMKVGPDYLKTVVSTLMQPDVGVATCLYVSHPIGGFWSKLGAMGINHGFLPSVLVGQAVGRADGCFGATMALTNDMLHEIGGLKPLENLLADDYMMGALVRQKGKKIGLVPLLPTTLAHEPEAGALISHEVRWGRTLASIDRMGYAGTLVTQAMPLGLLALLVDGRPVGLSVMVVAWLARVLTVRIQEQELLLRRQPIWMVVIRDFLTLGIQIAALSGRTVRWRGGHYIVKRHGILVSLNEGEHKP